MKKLMTAATLTCLSVLMATSAHANDSAIKSCYSILNTEAPKPKVEAFVFIDQTTPLDSSLQQLVGTNLANLIKPGQAFSIMQFSAFTQGKYARQVVSVTLDQDISAGERNAINKTVLTKFDTCLKQQPKIAISLATQALQASFSGTSSDIAKSDILASLKDLSSAVKQSAASRKVVILASDMLENSSISSFYSNNGVRKIDPNKEMGQATAARMIGNFSSAEVYVIGAGVLADPRHSQSYRDPKTMSALQDFWHEWFTKSNANLVEFGMPALLNSVH
ncbi:MAG: hypothetical protein RIR18_542 [Pseudomonadota bacterium]|jgi:hypothetical protein